MLKMTARFLYFHVQTSLHGFEISDLQQQNNVPTTIE